MANKQRYISNDDINQKFSNHSLFYEHSGTFVTLETAECIITVLSLLTISGMAISQKKDFSKHNNKFSDRIPFLQCLMPLTKIPDLCSKRSISLAGWTTLIPRHLIVMASISRAFDKIAQSPVYWDWAPRYGRHLMKCQSFSAYSLT